MSSYFSPGPRAGYEGSVLSQFGHPLPTNSSRVPQIHTQPNHQIYYTNRIPNVPGEFEPGNTWEGLEDSAWPFNTPSPPTGNVRQGLPLNTTMDSDEKLNSKSASPSLDPDIPSHFPLKDAGMGMSKTNSFIISTPQGTKSIFMFVISADQEFSSSKLSWISDDHKFGIETLDFTPPTGSIGNVFVDNKYGLPIGVISKAIPRYIYLVFTVPTARGQWDDMPASVIGPLSTRVGPDGNARMVQVKFMRPFSANNIMRGWTTATILYHLASEENA